MLNPSRPTSSEVPRTYSIEENNQLPTVNEKGEEIGVLPSYEQLENLRNLIFEKVEKGEDVTDLLLQLESVAQKLGSQEFGYQLSLEIAQQLQQLETLELRHKIDNKPFVSDETEKILRQLLGKTLREIELGLLSHNEISIGGNNLLAGVEIDGEKLQQSVNLNLLTGPGVAGLEKVMIVASPVVAVRQGKWHVVKPGQIVPVP